MIKCDENNYANGIQTESKDFWNVENVQVNEERIW